MTVFLFSFKAMAAIPVSRKAIMSEGVDAGFLSRKISESGYTIRDPVRGVFTIRFVFHSAV